MKKGKSLQELATEIIRQQSAKRDFLVQMSQAHAIAVNHELELGFDTGDDLFTAGLTENGHDQLGALCGIPAKYYDAMRKHPGLLAHNVQHWLNLSSDRRLIRSLDGNIRAILSDSYRRLDNFDLAQNILPMLNEVEAEVESCEITEKKLYIKAVTHKVQGEVRVGEVVSAGLIVKNSEVGHGSLSIEPLVFELKCTNGWIAERYAMRKYHVGRVQETEQIEFSNEALNAEDKAFWLKTRDLVKHALSEVTFRKIVETMRDATERRIEEPTKALELATDRYAFLQSEKESVLKHLIEGGDLTSFGLGAAVTRAAQDVLSYDRSTELEAIGFQILERSWN
jgi:hypothetical protein